tara:strand:+ start:7053 stop:7997 length:945 start_codon:yes stop_codon:yes gene_type:complete
MILSTAMTLALSAGMAGPCSSPCTAEAQPQVRMTTVSYDHHGAKKDIVDTAVAAGSFNTLAAALGAADLVEALKGEGPFTVFAPTDAAFAKLPAGTVETLLKPENKAQLQAILLYHVVPGKAVAKDVVGKPAWATLNGQQINISTKGETPMVDNAKIVSTDVMASNGVIHVIDTVILPETKSIPQVAEAAGSFTTLLAAVKTAGLAETLMGEGPFTVFAPSDEAFAALGSTVQDLLKPENRETLTSILTYHVVPGRVFAAQAKTLTQAPTVNGKTLKIEAKWGDLKVGGAKVVAADFDASNGVIHVIDGVLIPE